LCYEYAQKRITHFVKNHFVESQKMMDSKFQTFPLMARKTSSFQTCKNNWLRFMGSGVILSVSIMISFR
jgi:hypothetical protein